MFFLFDWDSQILLLYLSFFSAYRSLGSFKWEYHWEDEFLVHKIRAITLITKQNSEYCYIKQEGSNFRLLVNNDSIGYDLEGDDEILAIGKFNS